MLDSIHVSLAQNEEEFMRQLHANQEMLTTQLRKLQKQVQYIQQQHEKINKTMEEAEPIHRFHVQNELVDLLEALREQHEEVC